MKDNLKYLARHNLKDFLKALSKEGEAFVTVRKGESLYYELFDPSVEQDIVLGHARSPNPLKEFLFRAQEKLCADSQDVSSGAEKRVFIVGAKACDLAALKILDSVYKEGDFKDPLYITRRENSVIIACDCTKVLDTCFCMALDGKPFPEAEFDLNFSDLDEGYLIEVGSIKGREILDKAQMYIQEANSGLAKKRSKARDKMASLVKDNIVKESIPKSKQLDGAVEKGFESEIWKEEAQNCVECGACNFICPTCHCFFLADEVSKGILSFERFRLWDACLYRDFARVAGGANPRKTLWQRLRNRYEKKFDFFPKVLGEYACTGCGRCINCCPGKIDIRRILKNLVSP